VPFIAVKKVNSSFRRLDNDIKQYRTERETFVNKSSAYCVTKLNIDDVEDCVLLPSYEMAFPAESPLK
jgi:hypothetical protein